MTDRSRLASAALIYVLANGASAGLPFLMLPILTRVLDPAEYGAAAMFAVMVSVFGAVVGLNTHGAAGMRYFDRDKTDFRRYVAGCLVILAISTAGTLFLVWLFSGWLVKLANLPAAWLLIAVVVAAAQFVSQLQLSIWQSAGQAWRYGALKVGQAVLDAGASLVLVLVLHFGWQGRASGIALGHVLIAAVAVLVLVRGQWLRFPAGRENIRHAVRFGVPLVPHLASGMVLAMFDRFLIGHALGLASVGVYMVAVQVGMAMGLVTDAFNRAYAPWLVAAIKQQDSQRDVRIVRFTYTYYLGLLAAAILAGVYAQPLLTLLAGDEYREAAPAIPYVALGYALGGMYYMVTNYVFYAGRTWSLAVVTFVSGAVNIVAAVHLVQVNGIVGAAQAALIGKCVLFAGTWYLSQKCHPMPWARALAPQP